MKDNIRIALAVAAGYYLGRRRRLLLASGLAAAGLAGMLRRDGLLKHGVAALGVSPELENAFDRLRNGLTGVGEAAVAATSKQIDTFSSKIHDRAESVRVPSPPGVAVGEEDEEEQPYDESEEEQPHDESEEPEPAPRSRPVRRKAAARRA